MFFCINILKCLFIYYWHVNRIITNEKQDYYLRQKCNYYLGISSFLDKSD